MTDSRVHNNIIYHEVESTEFLAPTLQMSRIHLCSEGGIMRLSHEIREDVLGMMTINTAYIKLVECIIAIRTYLTALKSEPM